MTSLIQTFNNFIGDAVQFLQDTAEVGKDNAIHNLQVTAEVGRALGEHIVTFDRSEKRFTKFGTTNEAHLKGRDEVITRNLVAVALGALLLAFFVHGCVMQPGAMNYFMTGAAGFITLVALKEIAIQSIARSKEKEDWLIEESEETQYHFGELIKEFTDRWEHSINRFSEIINSNSVSTTKIDSIETSEGDY